MKKQENTKFGLSEFKCKSCGKFYKALVTEKRLTNHSFEVLCPVRKVRLNRSKCYECKRLWDRAYFKNNKTIFTNYEKTVNGILMRKYRNMKSRVLGIQKGKAHLYAGLELLPKEEFYEWAKDHEDFWKLYHVWVSAGYERRLCPTVDRINPKLGYTLDNMRWLSHGENSALANRRKKNPPHGDLNSELKR